MSNEHFNLVYAGIQQALDENPQDQFLHLVLADLYEENDRPHAAECLRWMVQNNRYPKRSVVWNTHGWTRESNPNNLDNIKEKNPAYHEEHKNKNPFPFDYTECSLPDEVFYLLPKEHLRGGYIHNECFWWESYTDYLISRQEAEEAAVSAWEKWRLNLPN